MKNYFLAIALLVGLLVVLTPIPSMDLSYSKILYDENNRLLSAKIADDGQWRFPYDGDIPKELAECIVFFEDEYFYNHMGVNPISIFKAINANIKAGKTVRGGSTLTMQVMRMFYQNQPRTFYQKTKEMIGAFKLELLYPKSEILKLWSNMAPFGGNTVGAQTAARRYYNRDLNNLSWSEYATLAVLPNNPSYIHMGKNTEALLHKKNRLLKKLYDHEIIDSLNYSLSLEENVDVTFHSIPQKSLHALEYLIKKHPDKSIFHSTLDGELQRKAISIVDNYSKVYQHDGIKNMATIIINHVENKVVAYIGNSNNENGNIQYVDCAQGLRSYGSLLKPFLYAHAMDKGYFTPHEKVKDIPTNLRAYTPKNFDRQYRGVIPISDMVTSSLNVPAVRVLNYVGLESFHNFIRNDLQLESLHPDPFHHGLSLILGGAEASLWDMARLYKGLLRNLQEREPMYNEPTLLMDDQINDSKSYASLHPLSVWYVLQSMMSLERPKDEQQFAKMGGTHIAWKTGTSYGHRDAWAIGANDTYVVAVWVGNEDGQGMHNLTGVKRAAPVLFRLFRHLDGNELAEHKTEARSATICKESRMLAGHLCDKKEAIFLPCVSHKLRNCNHHIPLDNGTTIYHISAVADFYYQKFYGVSINQKAKIEGDKNIKIVYPEYDAIIQVPKKLDQNFAEITAQAHTNYQDSKLFWYLDNNFLATTESKHEMKLDLSPGDHQLYISDQYGNEQEIPFQVIKNIP